MRHEAGERNGIEEGSEEDGGREAVDGDGDVRAVRHRVARGEQRATERAQRARTRERHWMDVFEADTGLPQPQINPFFCHTLGMRPMDSALHMRVAMGSAGGAYFWVPLLRLTHHFAQQAGRLHDAPTPQRRRVSNRVPGR